MLLNNSRDRTPCPRFTVRDQGLLQQQYLKQAAPPEATSVNSSRNSRTKETKRIRKLRVVIAQRWPTTSKPNSQPSAKPQQQQPWKQQRRGSRFHCGRMGHHQCKTQSATCRQLRPLPSPGQGFRQHRVPEGFQAYEHPKVRR